VERNEDYIRLFIDKLPRRIDEGRMDSVFSALVEMHPADIADVLSKVSPKNAVALVRLFEVELRSDVFAELEENEREGILAALSAKEIAETVIYNMDTDDAADLIGELPDDKQEEVILAIEDTDRASDIIDLLNYDEDTAGGLMAKELFKVNINWNVSECVVELRKQAEEIDEVHTVYVIDDKQRLVGIISLKKLILASPDTKISALVFDEIISVKADATNMEVSRIMDKYDLVVLPVVNSINQLIGRITIDDVVDLIVEEAEKDYQMLSGISVDVESSDSIWTLTRARFPWLLIGMFGGIAGANVIGVFENEAVKTPALMAFIPLIVAMGGNVGIQSSALVVQGLANKTLRGSLFTKLTKELGVGLVNGLLCAGLLLIVNLLLGEDLMLSFSISLSLLAVIVFAAIFGTWIPLAFHKIKVDPALATGPFITTANDIFGLMLYFCICQTLL
jgi:magnesium transporter